MIVAAEDQAAGLEVYSRRRVPAGTELCRIPKDGFISISFASITTVIIIIMFIVMIIVIIVIISSSNIIIVIIVIIKL